ncbi:MAG: hypothetical protein WAW86_10010 [Gammaproteobacteria bacterium]
MTKDIFLVLGVARSGTSVITRGLQALGVTLGDKLHPASSWNPKGFWEDDELVYKINRSILYFLNYPWINTTLAEKLQKGDDYLLNQFKVRAKQLLAERLATSDNWGFKDPRTILMLPFWQAVCKELSLTDKYIIAIRHPLASAHSNNKIGNGDVEAVLLTWLTQTMSAVQDTMNKPSVFVSYELMLQDAEKQLARINHVLSVNPAPNQQEIHQYTHQFLDNNLRHHVFDDAALSQHPAMAVMPLCMDLYKLLMRVATDEIKVTDDAFKNEWDKINIQFNAAKPLYHYLFTVLNKNKLLERQVRTIQKSLPWKLVTPLRKIDDILRFYRKKQRGINKMANAYE